MASYPNWLRNSLLTGCALALPALAAVVPAGTQLQVRLKIKIASNTSKPDDPVETTVIAPVMVNGALAIPAGVTLRGVVTGASAATVPAVRATRALAFRELEMGGQRVGVHTLLTAVENARESVNDKGEIQGILDGAQGFELGFLAEFGCLAPAGVGECALQLRRGQRIQRGARLDSVPGWASAGDGLREAEQHLLQAPSPAHLAAARSVPGPAGVGLRRHARHRYRLFGQGPHLHPQDRFADRYGTVKGGQRPAADRQGAIAIAGRPSQRAASRPECYGGWFGYGR